jgi:hypothetical protein
LTRNCIDVADSCVFFSIPQVLIFYQAVILLTYVVVAKIWIYDKLDPRHIICVLRFIAVNFLTVSLMNMAALAIFQAWIFVRLGIGKFLFVCVLKKFTCPKITYFGCMLACGWLPLSSRSFNGLKQACRRTETEWHIKDSFVSWCWFYGWNICKVNKYSELYKVAVRSLVYKARKTVC